MTIDELIEQLKALPKDVRKHPLVDGRPAVGYRLAPLERISVERVLTAEDGFYGMTDPELTDAENVVGGTAALVVLALSLLLESNGTVLTFFCGLAVIVTLAGIWVVNFYPIWMEDSPEPAVFTTQVEKEFGVHDFSCPPDVISVKDGLPDAGTYRCTITDGKDESAVRDVRLVVTADNKVGLYDADGKALK